MKTTVLKKQTPLCNPRPAPTYPDRDTCGESDECEGECDVTFEADLHPLRPRHRIHVPPKDRYDTLYM